jgi:hypothetical protein
MKTGEGKTLVATLASISTRSPARACMSSPSTTTSPAATPNGWAASTSFLGLSVGIIVHGLDDEERREAYACDITYGTNNEFGFDYLRDNMKYELNQMVQRGHFFAIVDEVDSILIDEARTPLIISGPSEDRSDLYNYHRRADPASRRRRLRPRREAAHRQSDRGRQREYRGPAARGRPAQGSSTTSRTSRWCTTSIRRCGAQAVSSATRTTSSATARSSSSTSSPAA